MLTIAPLPGSSGTNMLLVIAKRSHSDATMRLLRGVTCPTGGVREFLSSPLAKNISLAPSGKSPAHFRPSRLDEEGRYARIVTKREAGCGGRDNVVCA
jgi:hypothetical protein